MNRHRPTALLACVLVAIAVVLAWTGPPASASQTGGATFVPPPPPPKKAKLVHGRVIAPASAPKRVKRVIAAANQIVRKPYIWGGGHGSFGASLARGYDCSGAVSHALHGGRFLTTPMASGDLMGWARKGTGRWITVYASASHAYVVVAGLRFDTSMHDPDAPGPATGPRWSKTLRRSASFVPRHPRSY
jgi:cell wall-associated NlpC family hydrolase